MPLNNGDLYLFTDLQVETYRCLPSMLSDALPDDFGKALIDRYMTGRRMVFNLMAVNGRAWEETEGGNCEITLGT